MTTLYYAPGACSLASHIALEETGAPYETVRLDLAKGDQRAAEYLAVNERGRVPALVDEDWVLTENTAILRPHRAQSSAGRPVAASAPRSGAGRRMAGLALHRPSHRLRAYPPGRALHER